MSRSLWQEPNLARAPFVNERPVRRLAIALWVLFALAAGGGIWMSQTVRRESGVRLADLSRLSAETVTARERAATLEADLRRTDLAAQNVRAEFLNRRIAERSFSWNRLFETLTREMPRGVRLLRLAPEGFTRERGRAPIKAAASDATRVALRITGEAEETEALLEFVDRLFRHPAFGNPNLSRESGRKDFKIQFDLTVDYLPQYADEPSTTTVGAAGSAGPGGPAGALGSAPSGSGAAGSLASAAAAGAAARLATPGAAAAPFAGSPKPADAGARAAGAAPGRLPPSRSFGGGSGRGDETAQSTPEESAGADEGKTPDPRPGQRGTRADAFGRAAFPPSGSAPGAGGIAPSPGPAGSEFPYNVLPTPLKPYASGGVR